MMPDNRLDQERIEYLSNLVRQVAEDSQVEDENGLNNVISMYQTLYRYSDEDAKRILKHVQSKMSIFMGPGEWVASMYKPWFFNRMKEIKMPLTVRNRTYMSSEMKLNSKVVSTVDRVTNEIMDLLGDPQAKGRFQRRGLVIGDVQSGKTNTYTTLCCKAADTGYKVIILLTGTLESLRKQTQARLEDGFVGRDTSNNSNIKNIEQGRLIGVGKIDNSVKVAVFTSRDDDFREIIKRNTGLSLSETNNTVLLVVKKNAMILDSLRNWLKELNQHNGIIDHPLLMIDDEADNASINTSKTDATAINSKLREILILFTKATYVGFTATPFANIFIDPDTDDEMIRQDLFPKDFVYCLRSPSNHVGPMSMFGPDAPHCGMVRLINDAEDHIPEKHKKDFKITTLPDSLLTAIDSYLLGCTIRDIRLEGRKHMSMMINVSKYTDVQESLRDAVKEELHKIRQSVYSYSHLPEADATADIHIKRLKKVWDAEFSPLGYDWSLIQNNIEQSIAPVQVRSINQKNGVKNLNYSEYPAGLRLIAIGGNSLSRGLTLEGLAVSYFYRRSQTYDTLMQMGRWYGYRDGYSDVCRVWLTEKSIGWYQRIAETTEELKGEVESMRNDGKTPLEFGLLVRNDIKGLLITARSKMATASDAVIIKNLSGVLIDTHSLYVDPENVRKNNSLIHRVVAEIEEIGIKGTKSERDNIVWHNVPKRYIIEILKNYKSPSKNVEFDTGVLKDFIGENHESLNAWDVVIQHGDSQSTETFNGLTITKVQKKTFTLEDNFVEMSRRQLSSPSNTKEGLSELEINQLEAEFERNHKDKQFSAKTYLAKADRKPLLIIYPISLEPDKEYDDEAKSTAIKSLNGMSVIGLAAGFPKAEGQNALMIPYKANRVYQKLGEIDKDEEE